MKDDIIEDEKEKKGINQLELGFNMLDNLLGDENFINLTNEIAKKMDVEQLMSNILKQPELDMYKNTPEEIEKFKDKDENIGIGGLYKYSLGKIGFSKNEQDIASESFMKLINNPNLNKISQNIKTQNNPNDNINNENIIKKSEDNNDFNNLLK